MAVISAVEQCKVGSTADQGRCSGEEAAAAAAAACRRY